MQVSEIYYAQWVNKIQKDKHWRVPPYGARLSLLKNKTPPHQKYSYYKEIFHVPASLARGFNRKANSMQTPRADVTRKNEVWA